MSVVWAAMIAAVGVLFFAWGRSQSDFVIYRLLAARSRLLWGDRVHGFYQVIGVILVLVGLLFALLG